MELYKDWLHADPEFARDLHRVEGGHDKIKALAAKLEALDATEEKELFEMAADILWDGEPLTPTEEEKAADEAETHAEHIRTLGREAYHLLAAWELEQITPTAAKGLAAMANNPRIYPKIEILPCFGPEDVNDILRDWARLHPDVMEETSDEDGVTIWRESTLIPLAEYARRNGKDPATARQKAGRGAFYSARKVGRDWLISASEPWPDHRRKS
ncbi:MAG: hypothetical protein LUD78_04960 [Clostridiales bacterium]|nr:hypothetical protein [Clostridiales bacterium]